MFARFKKFLRPLREPRLWIALLWSTALAIGWGLADGAERRFADRARSCVVVLLPANPLDEAARARWREQFLGEAGLVEARWTPPAETVRELGGRFPQRDWRALFPTDGAWLPWTLTARFSDPLSRADAIARFVEQREREGDWRLTLWDAAALRRLSRARRAVRATLIVWTLLIGGVGLIALGAIEPQPGSRPMTLRWWGAALGVALPGVLWATAWLTGADPDPRALGIACVSGFALAGVAAPVIRRRCAVEAPDSHPPDAHP